MIDKEAITKQEMIKKAYALGFENEQKNEVCSQSVLAAVQDVMGFEDDATFKAAHALAGGGALTTEGTCGALAGGMLAISSIYGRTREDFSNGENVRFYRQSFKLSRKLYDRFVEKYGTPLCHGVHSCIFGRNFNMWDREEYAAFESAGGHVDKCPGVTGYVAAWAVELLLEARENTSGSKM